MDLKQKEKIFHSKNRKLEQDIQELEKKYVNVTKLLSTKNVELEQLRNSVRKYRQKVLEKERKLELMKMRKKKTQPKIKSSQIAYRDFLQAKKEVSELQEQLTSIKLLANHDKKEYHQYLTDLYHQYKDQINELKIRKSKAVHQLKAPIPTIVYDEILSNQVEDEIIPVKDIDFTTDDDFEEKKEIQELVSDNEIRRKTLEQRQQLLKEESVKYKSPKIKKSRMRPVSYHDIPPAPPTDIPSVDDKIKKIVDAIKSMKQRIAQFNEKTKEISEKYAEARESVETSYNEKSDRVADIKRSISNIQTTRLRIEEMLQKIRNLNNQYAENQATIARLKRRIENLLRDKNTNSERKGELLQVQERYEQKKREYEERAILLEEKKQMFEAEQLEYTRREQEIKLDEERINKLEEELTETRNKAQEAVAEVRQLGLETDAVKHKYAKLHRDDSVPTFTEGLQEALHRDTSQPVFIQTIKEEPQ